MKWKYQIVRSDTVENFESSLNKLGSEGWEATPGAYAADESKKVSLGQGMPPSMRVGANVGRSHEALHSGLIPGAAIKRRTLGLWCKMPATGLQGLHWKSAGIRARCVRTLRPRSRCDICRGASSKKPGRQPGLCLFAPGMSRLTPAGRMLW